MAAQGDCAEPSFGNVASSRSSRPPTQIAQMATLRASGGVKREQELHDVLGARLHGAAGVEHGALPVDDCAALTRPHRHRLCHLGSLAR
eukprot:3664111-Prymnesium_polylepis.2